MMILVAGIRSLIRAVAATPSMTGMLTSINTISGLNCSQAFRASSPFLANPTISKSSSMDSTICKLSRINS
ncbi:hypothetical protein D1872_314360 [compost metagenome]